MANEPDRRSRGSSEGEPEPAGESAPEAEAYLCDLCGAEMLNRHCKLVCPGCGYQRDCSDP